jgi:hypothetical protein
LRKNGGGVEVAGVPTNLASTPPDTTAPVITNISTNHIASTTASSSIIQVSWNTNEPATSRVYYSTSSDVSVGATSTSFIANLALRFSHLLSLINLLPDTVYYLFVRSVDGAGNATSTPVFTATTTSSI